MPSLTQSNLLLSNKLFDGPSYVVAKVGQAFSIWFMRKLVSKIESELKEQEVCAVYNSELARVFPKSIAPEKRKQKIKRFAERHELDVTFYDVGLCAVFERPRRGSRGREVVLPLPLSAKTEKRRRKRRQD
jgi:hypothetical protein